MPVGTHRRALAIGFTARVGGIAAARRQLGKWHFVAACRELPVIAARTANCSRVMVGGLIPFVVARQPEAGLRVARDRICEFGGGGDGISAIFRGGGILHAAGLSVMKPVAKPNRREEGH